MPERWQTSLRLSRVGGRTSGTKKSLQDNFILLFNGNKADEVTYKHIWGNFLHKTVNKFKFNLTEGEHPVSEAQFLRISRTQAAEEKCPMNCQGGKCCNTNATSAVHQVTQMVEKCY